MFANQTFIKLGGMLVAALAMTSCSAARDAFRLSGAPPSLAQSTPSQRELLTVPVPAQPIPIAVYDFTDQTGQLKPSDSIQSLSRAVTQGGASMLVQSLRDAGAGRWFTVVERERLDNLLKERQIIREMRNRYLGEKETPAEVLPSLLFAGIVLEGGIIGYDTNLKTGGIGARFLAIGGSTQYRQNSVTIYLRAVSVKTGEVLASVVTHKSIVSVSLNASTFKFVTFDELLEAEAGVSVNEPTQIAVQSAIEKAVYALIMEGAQDGPRHLWSFSNGAAGSAALARYAAEKARSGALTRVNISMAQPEENKKSRRANATQGYDK
ncbi:CsgG/HfaB family protein [Sphingomonas sp. MMS24-J45]|uniref:CsgG/HfaB family protein n=1 Tax=Sphingomonas sp. MMS24-J45 TaxID=3238806 RepID=UPI00384D426D